MTAQQHHQKGDEMAQYHVSSSMPDRINLKHAAYAEGREAAEETWRQGLYDFTSRDDADLKADAAFDLAWEQCEEREREIVRPDGTVDFVPDPFADDRDVAREWYCAGFVSGYQDTGRALAQSGILEKLDLAEDQFQALFAGQSGGRDGNAVADDIAARYGLPPDWREGGSLGHELAARGVLTVAEGQYLDDLD